MNKFFSPKNIDELITCLKNMDDNTYILAGGTDISIKINEKKLFDFDLIDISNLDYIKTIEKVGDEIIIGAGVTMSEIEDNEIVKKHFNALYEAAKSVGSTQIRNRATIGGNAANASQSADTLTPLFLFDSKCETINGAGEIKVRKLDEIILGLGKSNLKKDEIITRFFIEIPNKLSGFSKIGDRKSVTISKLNCSICLNEENGKIKKCNVYLGAVGPKPIKATIIENSVLNKPLNINTIYEIKEFIKMEIENAIPDRPSKHYKKEAAIGVVLDVFENIISYKEAN